MPGKFDQNLVSRIQQASDIVEVISEHLTLQRKGRDFVGLCPFHSDHRPSMYVSSSKQIFKCFACGAGGDVFKFVQLRENLDFPRAIQRLAERAGIRFEPIQRGSVGESGTVADPKQLARVNSWAMKIFQGNLNDPQKGQVARDYIRKRQINEESAQRWGLGVALEGWDSLVSAAVNQKISEKLLVASGLAVLADTGRCYDKFRNRLMFPILDVTGRVIGFGGRTLGDDPAKYMNSPTTPLFDKSNNVYGLDQARIEIGSSETAVVVEGYTDVMMAHQFGCRNVVAALGTSFTEGHARLLRRYAKKIVLVFDSDVAGREAANRALEVCLSQKIDIQLAFVTEGKDPCDFLLAAGADAFRRIVEQAVDVMDYKWKRLMEGLSGKDTFMDRQAAIEEYLRPAATAIRSGRIDPVAMGLVIARLSERIGMSKDQVRQELLRLSERSAGNAVIAQPNQQVVSINLGSDIRAKVQAEILSFLLNEPKLYPAVRGRLKLDYFTDPSCRQIAEGLLECLENGREVTEAGLLAGIEETSTAATLVHLADRGRNIQLNAQRLEQSIEALETLQRDEHRRQIRSALTDEDRRLRDYSKMLTKKNVRNPGLLPR